MIFDLDETVIDSRHRTPNNPDGTINLSAYHEKHTPENVFKDTLLPLASVMKQAKKNGITVWVCTARDMLPCDYEFLNLHGLGYDKIMSRDRVRSNKHYNKSDGAYKKQWLNILNLKQYQNAHVVMFDDAKPVLTTIRKMGIIGLNAHKVNRRLSCKV